MNLGAAPPEQDYPYALEDFGVLQLSEYVDIAKVANASSSHSSM
jgi:hypothetical protein